MVVLHRQPEGTLSKHLWVIILAGGNGERLQPAIQAWLGEQCPKQYCTFTGTRSMIQHTLDRATALVPPERLITIVARSHESYLRRATRGPVPGTLIWQPSNRGTGAGVFLALAYVLSRDPDATVVIFPSDHFIFPEQVFIQKLRDAALSLPDCPNRLVLVGVKPATATEDYGWILPATNGRKGSSNGRTALRPVSGFWEKPKPEAAKELLGRQALWNTMILLGRGRTLWSAGLGTVPSLLRRLQAWQRTLRSNGSDQSLDGLFAELPQSDFSKDVLARSYQRILALELDQSVKWSDWGRSDRIVESLRSIGRIPYFNQLASV